MKDSKFIAIAAIVLGLAVLIPQLHWPVVSVDSGIVSMVEVVHGEVYATKRNDIVRVTPAPTTTLSETCMGSVSIPMSMGISTPGFGMTWHEECVRLKHNAKHRP